jgi:hypothetical protein
VIQLYEEDENYKEIAKLTHESIRDIGAIIKRHQENIERENGQLEETNEDYDVNQNQKFRNNNSFGNISVSIP